MCASEMPAAAAEVAAPILKLWSAYFLSSSPAFFSVASIMAVKHWRVMGFPERNTNRGLGESPLITRYDSRATSGHSGSLVFAKNRSTPRRNGSVFEALM